jgi:hypothetical protein
VERGETIEITDRGRPATVLAPPPQGSPLDQHRAAGEIDSAIGDLDDMLLLFRRWVRCCPLARMAALGSSGQSAESTAEVICEIGRSVARAALQVAGGRAGIAAQKPSNARIGVPLRTVKGHWHEISYSGATLDDAGQVGEGGPVAQRGSVGPCARRSTRGGGGRCVAGSRPVPAASAPPR